MILLKADYYYFQADYYFNLGFLDIDSTENILSRE